MVYYGIRITDYKLQIMDYGLFQNAKWSFSVRPERRFEDFGVSSRSDGIPDFGFARILQGKVSIQNLSGNEVYYTA